MIKTESKSEKTAKIIFMVSAFFSRYSGRRHCSVYIGFGGSGVCGNWFFQIPVRNDLVSE